MEIAFLRNLENKSIFCDDFKTNVYINHQRVLQRKALT